MNRREFIGWIGVGALASSLPVAIAACGGGETTSGGSDGGLQPVGSVGDLSAQGQIFNEGFAAGPVLVIADPQNTDQVIAVNPTCTHSGCTVGWLADQSVFECPCHSSRFAVDGSVEQGPATSPLAVYTTQVDGDSILVGAG